MSSFLILENSELSGDLNTHPKRHLYNRFTCMYKNNAVTQIIYKAHQAFDRDTSFKHPELQSPDYPSGNLIE
jgi:hypothetical protein